MIENLSFEELFLRNLFSVSFSMIDHSVFFIIFRSPSVSESSNDSSKISGPVNGNECYFWRTTGCVFENQCRYRHVRGHKGVDLPKVQAKYGKLPASS